MSDVCPRCRRELVPGAQDCARCAAAGTPVPARTPDIVSSSGPDVRPPAASARPDLDAYGLAALAPTAVPSERRPRGPRTGQVVAVAAAALLTAGVGGAAVFASTMLGGGGSQPEDVLPSNAIGFVKVDFDPAAGQKVAAYRLAKKFPDSGVRGEDSVRDDLLRSLLDDEDRAQFDEQVGPWLGARAGLALLPPSAAAPDEPVVLAAVQVTDRDKARAGLAELAAEQGGEDLHWAFPEDEGYVLLGEDQAELDRAAGAERHLSDTEHFTRGVEALDGDQVALGWLDIAGGWRALPEAARQEALEDQPGLDPKGLVVFGASVEDDAVEVVGRSLELSAGSAPELQALLDSPLGRTAPTGLLGQLPADTTVAMGFTGLGEGLAQLYDTFADEQARAEVEPMLEQYGLRLPDDLRAVLGSELALGIGGTFTPDGARVDLRVRSEQPARAAELLELARDAATAGGADAGKVDIAQTKDGYTLGYSAGASSGGRLSSSEVFQRTVPDADRSGVTYYADIARLLDGAEQVSGDGGGMTAKQRRNLAPLRGVGYTARLEEGGSGTFRFRLTVAD